MTNIDFDKLEVVSLKSDVDLQGSDPPRCLPKIVALLISWGRKEGRSYVKLHKSICYINYQFLLFGVNDIWNQALQPFFYAKMQTVYSQLDCFLFCRRCILHSPIIIWRYTTRRLPPCYLRWPLFNNSLNKKKFHASGEQLVLDQSYIRLHNLLHNLHRYHFTNIYSYTWHNPRMSVSPLHWIALPW